MPLKEKTLADDQQMFVMTGIEQAEAILHQLSDDRANEVARLFSPKSYFAKTLFEQKQNQQNRHKQWLDTIMKRHTDLQLSKIRIQELVDKSKTGGTAISPTMIANTVNKGSSGSGHGI